MSEIKRIKKYNCTGTSNFYTKRKGRREKKKSEVLIEHLYVVRDIQPLLIYLTLLFSFGGVVTLFDLRAESLDMFVSVKDTENMSKPSKSEKRGRCTRTIVAR